MSEYRCGVGDYIGMSSGYYYGWETGLISMGSGGRGLHGGGFIGVGVGFNRGWGWGYSDGRLW